MTSILKSLRERWFGNPPGPNTGLGETSPSSALTPPFFGRLPVLPGEVSPCPNLSALGHDLGTEFATLIIGEEDEDQLVLKVHKTLICKIKYFDKMFNGAFLESNTNKGTFPEDDQEAFRLLVAWIYRGQLEVVPHRGIDGTLLMLNYTSLVELFGLAEKFQITALADEVMDVLVYYKRKYDRLPSGKLVLQCYHATHENSKLRVFMSRILAYQILKENGLGNNAFSNDYILACLEAHEDLLRDVLPLLRPDRANDNPSTIPECDYHQHKLADKCPYPKRAYLV